MTHQVKDPAGAVTAVAHIAAMVQVRSVAWELPYDMGAAKKKKKFCIWEEQIHPPTVLHFVFPLEFI